MSDSHVLGVYRAAGAQFTTTHWSIVLAAGDAEASKSATALETLCRAYWYPLYAYIRRRGYAPHDAQDLTQKFFARLLDRGFLRGVDRNKGKFRSFLLATLDHFLANEWRNAHAQKRGGRVSFLPLDDGSAEEHYLQIPAAALSPEQLFEQQWATALLDHVLTKLREEFEAAGKNKFFEAAKIFLTGERRAGSYEDLAKELGVSEAALKMAVSRMRHRYAELLRAEVADTVSNPEEVEDEIRALFAALSR
jgi:RNA polymerase sigma factor (sigma-70 family)